jgi:LmbE family N-acetylglucosaminyl deacetylase
VPFEEDAHPDHRAVTRIVEDARFDAKLTKLDLRPSEALEAGLAALGVAIGPPIYPRWLFHYYATHLRIVPQPSFLFDISSHADQKRRAILAYRSQFVVNEKNRAVVEWVDAANGYFGSRIGVAAAEPFFAKEPLGLRGLEGVVMGVP